MRRKLGIHLQGHRVGDQHDVVLAVAQEAPLLLKDADHAEPPPGQQDRLADDPVVEVELAEDLTAQDADVMALLDVDDRERPAQLDLEVADRVILGRGPLDGHAQLVAAVLELDVGRADQGRDPADGRAALLDRGDVAFVELDPAQPLARLARRPFGPDPHRVGAQSLEELGHVPREPLDHTHDRDRRGHRDHDPQHREHRPQPMGPQLLERALDVGEDDHDGFQAPWQLS